MGYKCVVLILLAAGLMGCATTKNWEATGGSKADGVVKLSYQYGFLEQPILNEQQGIEVAKSRCAAWGYSGAEAFGGETKICTESSQSGCNSWLISRDFQCTGNQGKAATTQKQ